MGEQRQLNVNLPAELVRACKHAAIDADMSLGAFVAEALVRHLAALRAAPAGLSGPPAASSERWGDDAVPGRRENAAAS